MSEEGGKYQFRKGGGINIVFGPKYRPLVKIVPFISSAFEPESESTRSVELKIIRIKVQHKNTERSSSVALPCPPLNRMLKCQNVP